MKVSFKCQKCDKENELDVIGELKNNLWPNGGIAAVPGWGSIGLAGIAAGLFGNAGKEIPVKCKYCNETNVLEI